MLRVSIIQFCLLELLGETGRFRIVGELAGVKLGIFGLLLGTLVEFVTMLVLFPIDCFMGLANSFEVNKYALLYLIWGIFF